jgi:hypothetical protein
MRQNVYSPKKEGPLDFSDWLQNRGNEAQSGWIVVGEVWRTEDAKSSTFTYLVAMDSLEARLAASIGNSDSSDVQRELVNAYVEARAYGANFDPAWDDDGPIGLRKRPLVVESTFFGYQPMQMDFVQPFILFWNAFWQGETLRRLDHDGTLHDVGRKTRTGENIRLEADLHHLRGFLAVVESGALRIHDHLRFSQDESQTSVDEEFHDHTGHFQTVIAKGTGIPDYKWYGRTFGKDAVLPYNDLKRDPREGERGHERFIIGRATDGSDLEASSDEGRGDAPFLTPVYFLPEVLRRYYDASDRYSVDSGDLRCLYLWNLPMERRADDLVEAYLGDLGRIPYSDQRHFRAYNVQPPGTGISEERFRRDFMVEWIEPQNDPVFDFKKALRFVNGSGSEALGKPLFRPLLANDGHVFEGLRVPLTESSAESDAQIIALAKITADSLDVDLLRANVAASIDTRELKSIALLEAVLHNWGVADPRTVTQSFRDLLAIRGSGSAHRRGSGSDDALRRAGLLDVSNKELVAQLLAKLTESLMLLRTEIRRRFS